MQVVAVCQEENRDLASFLPRQLHTEFPVIYDPDGKISALYEVGPIPYNLAIDRNGNVIRTVEGFDPEALQEMVLQLAVK